MDDWVRWGLGLISAGVAGLAGWLLAHIGLDNKIYASMEKRISLLEAQPKVDPVAYAEVMAKLTAAVATLTTKLSETDTERRQQFAQMREDHEQLRRMVESLVSGRAR